MGGGRAEGPSGIGAARQAAFSLTSDVDERTFTCLKV